MHRTLAAIQNPRLLLQIGLAAVFLYAAIAAFINPNEWIGYLPPIMTKLVDAKVALDFFSVLQIGLAGWLLSGVYVRWAALASAAMLAGIISFNLGLFDIAFRDVGLLFAALALACYND